jgi:catechol 2,3-dioxygenase-like lactoylglutathione lyase family enzyme
MKLQHLSPILFTKDLAQTILFYETILGFKAESDFPNFVSLTRDEVNIMFVLPTVEPEDFFSKPQLTGNIFIFTDQVDHIWDLVKDKVTIKTPIADRAYLMRDFSILDNNGYELVFGEDISSKRK